MQEKHRTCYCLLGNLGRNRDFSIVTELMALCRDMVLCVATWSLGYIWLLGHDKGSPGRDRVVSLLVFCRDRGPHDVSTVLCSLS